MTIKDIEEKLLQWDAKHTVMLINLYLQNKDNHNFINQIISLYSKSVALQHATSWLIKYYVDNGNTLSEKQLTAILSNVKMLEHWENKLFQKIYLHIMLMILHHLPQK